MNQEHIAPDVDLRDRDDERSLVNMLPSWIGDRILFMPPEFLEMADTDLKESGLITELEEQLRTSFWIEYGTAVRTRRRMNPVNIYSGICELAYFKKHLVTNSYKLAYICRPPVSYTVKVERLLSLGMDQYEEILKLPNINAKGFVDSRLIAVKQRIIEHLDERARGAIVQRIESKNLNVNMEKTIGSSSVSPDMTIEQMEMEAQKLDEQLKKPYQIPANVGGTEIKPVNVLEAQVVSEEL